MQFNKYTHTHTHTSSQTHGVSPSPFIQPFSQVLDIAGSAERDVLDREGRHQAIVGSAGSVGLGVGGGGGGGIGGSLKRDLGGGGGRTRTGTMVSDAGSGILRAAGRSRVIEVDFNPFKRQDEKEVQVSNKCQVWHAVRVPGCMIGIYRIYLRCCFDSCLVLPQISTHRIQMHRFSTLRNSLVPPLCTASRARTPAINYLLPFPPPYIPSAALFLQLLKSRTHNRRRWTHVFAPGKKEFQTIDTMPGPIWVSLSQPALLPLSIDFLPTRNVCIVYCTRCCRLPSPPSMLPWGFHASSWRVSVLNDDDMKGDGLVFSMWHPELTSQGRA